ncbi:hypothetical protein HUO13_36000 [Saccharopolyspora erythraea]|uniref:hypothetical protein n=1 Tax=Saccharopolyspora erythraea TaxID=1836 RepID=UPI001BA874FC|nr:hypothetical protein [Saccharopolyspora erythraea]QUH05468.1 hypothetical protein HUO13_36000 [Saccharopolyspora erythraea]
MEPAAIDARLGRLLSTHPVDNRRRWWTGAVALAAGLAGVGLLAFFILAAVPGSGRVLGVALVLIGGGLPVAAIRLSRAVRGGRREAVELYEHGLARRALLGRRSWTWQEVSSLAPSPRHFPVASLPCTVRFTDGSKVVIDDRTADGARIGEALFRHCPDAPGHMPRWDGEAAALWGLPLLALASGAGIVLMIRYIVIYDGVTVEGPPGERDIPVLSDSMGAALAAGILACIVVLVMSLSLFFFLWRDR